MSVVKQTQPDKGLVLAKALLNVSDELGLKTSELAGALGVDRSGISRIKKRMTIEPQTNKGEIALYLRGDSTLFNSHSQNTSCLN